MGVLPTTTAGPAPSQLTDEALFRASDSLPQGADGYKAGDIRVAAAIVSRWRMMMEMRLTHHPQQTEDTSESIHH